MLADSLIVISRTYLYQEAYQLAVSSIQKSYEIYLEIDDQLGIARALSGIGANYGLTNQFKEALTYFEEAIVIFESINEQIEIARPIHNAGLTHFYLGNFEESANYFHKASLQGEKIGDQLAILSACHRLGQLYHAYDKNDEAIQYFKKSTTIHHNIGYSGLPSAPEPYLAWVYFSGGQYLNALEASLIHLNNIQKQDRDVESGLAHMVVGLVLTIEDFKEAKPDIDKLIVQITSITDLPLEPKSYFEFALESSRSRAHLTTLIPTLTYYGGFLYKLDASDLQNQGLQYLSEAKSLAFTHELGWSQKNIQKYSQQLGISFDEL